MAVGFHFAYREGGGEPHYDESALSGSAFSAGQVLQFEVGSTLSAIELTAAVTDIAAVALAHSSDSVNALLPVIYPGAGDIFLSRLTPTGSLITPGAEVDIEEDGQRDQYCGVSANTARLVMVKAHTDQSRESRVYVKFIYHAGNIDLS